MLIKSMKRLPTPFIVRCNKAKDAFLRASRLSGENL